MNRHMGLEAMAGVGGGTVSKESERNLNIAEDYCRKRKPKKAIPYLMKALEDPSNLDACIQCALLNDDISGTLEVLEQSERKGRLLLQRSMGSDCFEDGSRQVGHFWGILETRPYMRVLQALVEVYCEDEQYDKAAKTIIEMLRLCPSDNTGQRDTLGSVLLKASRASDALSFSQIWIDPKHSDHGDPPERGGTIFTTPSREPLSPELMEKLYKSWDGAQVYTAALAAFTLYGDCELARQYLRAAAKINPTVLTKILAKVEQPKTLNMASSRAFNGPEAAQDYLWLTQDLWMKPKVWAWANSDKEAKSPLLKTCTRPGCGELEVNALQFKRCGSCKDPYCSAECQKADWLRHKPGCKGKKAQEEYFKALGSGKPPSEKVRAAYAASQRAT